MGISTLQLEHLIDGKKPEARTVFAMFAVHFKTRVEECSRVVCTQSCVDPCLFQARCLLLIDVLNERLSVRMYDKIVCPPGSMILEPP